jgi:hypothetical protein
MNPIKSAIIQNSRYGVKDRCLEFDNPTDMIGATDYVYRASRVVNTQSFSVEFWIRIDDTSVSGNIHGYWLVCERGGSSFDDWNYQINYRKETNLFRLVIRIDTDPTVNLVVDSTTSPTQGLWYHVAAVCDATNEELKIYINGVLDATNDTAWGADRQILNDNFCISANGWSLPAMNWGLIGRMDEVRIWNHVRTADQIKRYMHTRLYGTETGLVAYYPMDEGTGSTAYDKSTNSNDGTITGATWIKP